MNTEPKEEKKNLTIDEIRTELEKNISQMKVNRDALNAEIKRSEAILKAIHKQVKE
jgi:hypothetical protein